MSVADKYLLVAFFSLEWLPEFFNTSHNSFYPEKVSSFVTFLNDNLQLFQHLIRYLQFFRSHFDVIQAELKNWNIWHKSTIGTTGIYSYSIF